MGPQFDGGIKLNTLSSPESSWQTNRLSSVCLNEPLDSNLVGGWRSADDIRAPQLGAHRFPFHGPVDDGGVVVDKYRYDL